MAEIDSSSLVHQQQEPVGSRFVNRVANYPIVSTLYGFYNSVAERTTNAPIVQKAASKFENTPLASTLKGVSDSVKTKIQTQQLLLEELDAFGCRQLDRIDHTIHRTEEVVTNVKDAVSNTVETSKQKIDTVMAPVKEVTEKFKPSNVRIEAQKRVQENVQRVSAGAQNATERIQQFRDNYLYSPINRVLNLSEQVINKVIPPLAETEDNSANVVQQENDTVQPVGAFGGIPFRVRDLSFQVSKRLQRRSADLLKSWKFELRAPARVAQLKQNGVDLIRYAAENIDRRTRSIIPSNIRKISVRQLPKKIAVNTFSTAKNGALKMKDYVASTSVAKRLEPFRQRAVNITHSIVTSPMAEDLSTRAISIYSSLEIRFPSLISIRQYVVTIKNPFQAAPCATTATSSKIIKSTEKKEEFDNEEEEEEAKEHHENQEEKKEEVKYEEEKEDTEEENEEEESQFNDKDFSQ